jgi:hypothetical protein
MVKADVARRARIGLMAVTAVVATTAGLFAAQAQTSATEAASCFERFIGAPINEAGTQCTGTPTVWKSHTFESSGIGYYTETEDLGGGVSQIRLGYKHDDGRIAISLVNCGASGCAESYWNGVPFPFSQDQ